MIKFENEENFQEALSKYYYYACEIHLNPITPDLQFIFDLLSNNTIESLIKRSNIIMSNFFIVMRALQLFYLKTGTLPVVGSIPDMTSDTETYISLKRM
jgi:hypothetical protein